MDGFYRPDDDYVKEMAIERKKYRSMHELEAMKLGYKDWYTWIRYERERIAMEKIGKK